MPLICSDCNASIGIRDEKDENGLGQDRVRGRFGVKYENTKGQDFCDLLGVNELCAATTFFKKREYATWYHPAR